MIGAIIGDVIGSRFERHNTKTKDFELFTPQSRFTDDTVLTVAVADAILNGLDYEETIRKYAQQYPHAGYGGTFKQWAMGLIEGPYNSWGNGSAMRVSPVGFAFNTKEEVLAEAKKTADVSHNHPEGVKGAQAIALGVFLAKQGKTKEEIKSEIVLESGYDLDRTIDQIRPDYRFDVSCAGSVPEAIISFLESTDFEDAIRTAISLGGDSDTIACMAGALAEAFYDGVPEKMEEEALNRLPEGFRAIISEFEAQYG